jgi:hypothetical protein
MSEIGEQRHPFPGSRALDNRALVVTQHVRQPAHFAR